ncbi:MAG: ATPase [Candidatus Latescibacteria bacterium]|nr:ATPase [Candidatus Latescibacterota bacterium]
MGAVCFAAQGTGGAEAAEGAATTLADGIKYLAAALAVGLSAIATGFAQSKIGAAGMGAIVEKPESIGAVLICLAIPETMVILGFVVAAMIIIF